MSWTIAGVMSGNTTVDTSLSTFTIPSQSYTAGVVYFVGFLWANLVNAQAGALVGITGSGLSPTLVSAGNYGASTSRRRLEVWTFTPAVTASVPLLVTFAAGENSTAHCWSVVSTNAATSGTLPQAAVMNRSASASTITATLSAFASAGNAALGFFGAVGSNGAMTVGSGFTQLHSEVVASGTTICLLSEYVASQDTTVDATAGGVNDIIGIGFELAASSVSVTAPAAGATAEASAPVLSTSVAGAVSVAMATSAAPTLSVALTAAVGASDAQSPGPTLSLAVQALLAPADAIMAAPSLSASLDVTPASAVAASTPPGPTVTLGSAPGSATTSTVLHVLALAVIGSAANATASFPTPTLPIGPGGLTATLESATAVLTRAGADAALSTSAAAVGAST